MPENQHRLTYLYERFMDDRATAEEVAEFWRSFREAAADDPVMEAIFQRYERPAGTERPMPVGEVAPVDWQRVLDRILGAEDGLQAETGVDAGERGGAVSRRLYWWAAAAIVLVLLGAGGYFAMMGIRVHSGGAVVEVFPGDIAPPAGTRTTLTLANGQQIVLDSVGKGVLAKQGEANVSKLADGQLAYYGGGGQLLYNTLSTGRGGQTMVVLADGTKVWLDALTSLRYPTSFVGDRREVELDGEAYFEVAKNSTAPFTINVKGKVMVDVLGTHFNINAYSDEPAIMTTLLEGSVRVRAGNAEEGQKGHGGDMLRGMVIQPGEQAVVGDDGAGGDRQASITKREYVDLEAVMAWKNGRFRFNGASIESILQQAARWYDMKVIYKDAIHERFSGQIPRNVPVSQLLNILSATDKVKFKIDGNNVTVLRR